MDLSNSVKVGWCPITLQEYHPDNSYLISEWQNVGVQPPESVFKSFRDDGREDSHVLLCPAFIGYLKNTFLIRSPIDFTLSVNSNTKTVSGDRFDQRFFNEWVANRDTDFINPNKPFISVGPRLVFVADEDIIIESLPAMLHNNEFIQNTNIIPGSFNIHRWVRPIDVTFEVIDTSKPIIFRRGDPLMYVRFIDPKGRKVELERIEQTQDLIKTMYGMTALKTFVPMIKLEKLYGMAHDWIKNRIWLPKKSKKCPFKWK